MGAGLIGFLVVLALVVAAIFLFRSMSRHLRKVPQSFDPPPVDTEPSEPVPSDGEDPPVA